MTLTLSTLIVLLVPAIALVGFLFVVRRQIAALQRRSALPSDWTPELSVDRYQPMFRLLDDNDIQFLRAQPGATPALVKRLRHARCQVFRGYLRTLQRDFRTASQALILVMMQSPSDRRDILRALIRSHVKFNVCIFRVRCRLLLYRWNVGTEPVARLVSLFESLQLELLALAPIEESLRP